MGKNIVLIGFMGTGKSAVGMKLAQRLRCDFVDMDREIEELMGMSISRIFRQHGEIRFRSEEALMTKKIASKENQIIATGGGFVLQEQNFEALRDNSIFVCLEADPEIIFERVNRKKGTRPLLKKDAGIDDVKTMLQEREEYYARADIKVDTSNKGLEQVVDEIIQIVKKKRLR